MMKPKPGQYAHIQDTVESIDRYVNDGIPPGDFLFAVLSNNLKESFKRADSNNCRYMADIVRYLYNYVPSACWGSPESVKTWLDFKRQQREMERVSKR